jgi:membrane protease YdiL (CAAX protease family)
MTAVFAHLLFVLLLLAPLQSARAMRMLEHNIRSNPQARIEFYRSAMLGQWVLVPVAVLASWTNGSTLATLGLVLPAISVERFLLVLIIAAIVLSQSPLIPIVHKRMIRSPSVRRSIYPLRNLLPRSDEEKRVWVGVAVTAGCCEEVLFRGFLFHYLQTYFGAGLFAVVALSSAVFGFSHYYQGSANMLRVGFVGMLLGLTYVATDSLFFPIMLHILLDLGGLLMDEIVPADTPKQTPG